MSLITIIAGLHCTNCSRSRTIINVISSTCGFLWWQVNIHFIWEQSAVRTGRLSRSGFRLVRFIKTAKHVKYKVDMFYREEEKKANKQFRRLECQYSRKVLFLFLKTGQSIFFICTKLKTFSGKKLLFKYKVHFVTVNKIIISLGALMIPKSTVTPPL